MSNHRLHITILYFILIIAFITIGFGLFQKSSATDVTKIVENDNRNFFWDIYPELVIPNTGKTIDKDLNVEDLNDKKISIQDLSKKKPLLVFRYSRYDCHLCIDQVLDKLQTIFEGEEDKVCLIVDGMSARDFRIKHTNIKIKFLTYFVIDSNLRLSLENKNLPFLFVLSPDSFKTDKIFIPFREYPNQTDAYLRNVKAILND